MRLAIFLLLSSCLAAEIVGPGGGGAMFHPTVSPHDPQTMLVSCDMTGAYISHDGGVSWRMFNLGGTVRFFAFDPKDSRTIYAGATGLWRSTDAGLSWSLIWPRQTAITGIQINSDHADATILSRVEPAGAMEAFAIDPHNARVLIAAARNAVYRSTDSGASWTKVMSLAEPAMRVWILDKAICAATAHGISKDEVTNPTPAAFTGVSAAGDTVYGVSSGNIWVSRDVGRHWTAAALPGNGATMQAIATSVRHPETAYVSYSDLKADGKVWSGVAQTRDFGKTWTVVWKEAATMAPNIHDAWIAPSMGPGWGGNPLALGVADQDPRLCIGTDYGRTMITRDGGENWYAAYSRHVPGAAWTTTGLDVTSSYGYHVDPFDPLRRFITYTDIGLSRSEDGGKSWTRSVEGVPREWTNTTYWVEFDPKVKGRMWGAMSYTHDLPRPKMWRNTPVEKFRGGICVSDDGGRTWRKSNTGMPETAPTHILLDPASPVDARILYVASMGRGVYKSNDAGGHWVLKNTGIQGTNPLAWRLVRAGDGALYVLIARRGEHGEMHDSGDGAIYRSIDAAETWQRIPMPAGTNAPNGLAVDSRDSKRLYLATWARALGLHGEGGGIWISSDAGATWRNVLDRDQHVYDVTIDPHDVNVLFACGFESSAWRSTDRGEHWDRIGGYDFKWGHRVFPDPANAHMIFITTFGGSVWHGPWEASSNSTTAASSAK